MANPPFPKQRQEWPGTESEMQPKPDSVKALTEVTIG